MNTAMFREIADRIEGYNPGIAGYNQGTFGQRRVSNILTTNPPPVTHECETECCIAGHAFLLAHGFEEKCKYIDPGTGVHYGIYLPSMAQAALQINNKQANALFRPTIIPEEIIVYFNLEISVLEYEQMTMSEVLRLIADTYDAHSPATKMFIEEDLYLEIQEDMEEVHEICEPGV